MYNNFLSTQELENSMKEPVDIEHTHTKNSRFITYDSSDYDGGGLYDD